MNLSKWIAAGYFLALASCGGSTGTMAELDLMDAPPDGVTAVNIYVAAMQVHVAGMDEDKNGDPNDDSIDDDGKWESLTVGRSIDLVQHQGETAADVLGQLPLPAGKITQIRLVIDTTQPNTAVKDGMTCDLDTSRLAKNGVKIEHAFKAFKTKDGAKHQIIVDFKLKESLIADGTCFRLEPKLDLHKVKIEGADVDLKLP